VQLYKAMDLLKFPTILETPMGSLYRHWAVLDHTKQQALNGGHAISCPVWSEFPDVLNLIMNNEIYSLAKELDGGSAGVALVVKYQWPRPNEENSDEMIVDLVEMTQENTATQNKRKVTFFYKPL
jgi:hypothetical protein